jgi:hypothetical protein
MNKRGPLAELLLCLAVVAGFAAYFWALSQAAFMGIDYAFHRIATGPHGSWLFFIDTSGFEMGGLVF